MASPMFDLPLPFRHGGEAFLQRYRHLTLERLEVLEFKCQQVHVPSLVHRVSDPTPELTAAFKAI